MVSDERLVHSSTIYNNKHTCIHKKKAVKAKHLPEAIFPSGLLQEGHENSRQGVSPRGHHARSQRPAIQEDHSKSRRRAVWVRQPRTSLLCKLECSLCLSSGEYITCCGPVTAACLSLFSSFLGNVDPLILFLPYHCLLGVLCNVFFSL